MTELSPQDAAASAPDDTDRARELDALLDFWFDLDPNDPAAIERAMRRWFTSTPEQDRALAQRFGALAEAAAAGELDALADSPRARLALIILLDQLPRNLYRGTPRAFAADARALELALDGIDSGLAERLAPLERIFFMMPLQHAESPGMQQRSVAEFEALAAEDLPAPLAAMLGKTATFAKLHRDIVERFGRFPHRNEVLGRASSAAEREFLDSGGPSFGQ